LISSPGFWRQASGKTASFVLVISMELISDSPMDKLLFLTRTFHAVVQELRVTFRCVCFSQILGQKRKSAIGTSPRVNFRESRDVISVSSLSASPGGCIITLTWFLDRIL
jgi:hypothetical protein